MPYFFFLIRCLFGRFLSLILRLLLYRKTKSASSIAGKVKNIFKNQQTAIKSAMYLTGFTFIISSIAHIGCRTVRCLWSSDADAVDVLREQHAFGEPLIH